MAPRRRALTRRSATDEVLLAPASRRLVSRALRATWAGPRTRGGRMGRLPRVRGASRGAIDRPRHRGWGRRHPRGAAPARCRVGDEPRAVVTATTTTPGRWWSATGCRAGSRGGPLDIARSPEAVAPADVVVLHRVVCCYPDHVALLTAAGEHARPCSSSATRRATSPPACCCGWRTRGTGCAGVSSGPTATTRPRWWRWSRAPGCARSCGTGGRCGARSGSSGPQSPGEWGSTATPRGPVLVGAALYAAGLPERLRPRPSLTARGLRRRGATSTRLSTRRSPA